MNRGLFILIILLIFHSAAIAQPSFFFPGYDELKKPDFKRIAYTPTPTKIHFIFNDIEFIITNEHPREEYPRVLLKHGGKKIYAFRLGSIYFETEYCDIRSFDADNNGFDDLFIAFAYGPSGRNSSIQVINAFFFMDRTVVKFKELKSFYDRYDLFRDFNNDGLIEFACTKWERFVDGTEYDFTNLFAIKDGAFINISNSTEGFPLISEWKKGKRRVLDTVPEKAEEVWFLEKPDVLNRDCEVNDLLTISTDRKDQD